MGWKRGAMITVRGWCWRKPTVPTHAGFHTHMTRLYPYPYPRVPTPVSTGTGFRWVRVRVEVEWPTGYPWRALLIHTCIYCISYQVMTIWWGLIRHALMLMMVESACATMPYNHFISLGVLMLFIHSDTLRSTLEPLMCHPKLSQSGSCWSVATPCYRWQNLPLLLCLIIISTPDSFWSFW
jgi:hypothetical protein